MKKLSSLIILIFISVFASDAIGQVPSYVPTNGLKGFWPFCNNANDHSGNGNNGTATNAILSNDRFNMANNAYSFNGTSAYIATNMTGILGSNARAVAFWAKTAVSNSIMCGVSWGDEQSNPNYGVRYECAFNFWSTGPSYIGSDCAITYSCPSPSNDNNWHHYVYQYNGIGDITNVEVYQDGVLLTNVTSSHNPNAPVNTSSNWSVNFGRIPYTIPHYFNGSLDDIGIWDRVLTPTEIQQLFEGDRPCVSVGVSEWTSNIQTIKLFPIPSKDKIELVMEEENKYSYEIYNLIGQLEITGAFHGKTVINIEKLQPGIYNLVLKDDLLLKHTAKLIKE